MTNYIIIISKFYEEEMENTKYKKGFLEEIIGSSCQENNLYWFISEYTFIKP